MDENHNGLRRLYREEGLQARRRRIGCKRAAVTCVPLLPWRAPLALVDEFRARRVE